MLAPAKINLSLTITGKRPGGYHTLASLVVFTDWGDRVTLTPCPHGEVRLCLSGSWAGALAAESPEDNLAVRAVQGVRKYLNITEGADIHLEKHIPVGAGVGGGSADAAAALRLAMQEWGVGGDAHEDAVREMALSLGADIPVCLAGAPAWMTGVGEQVHPLVRFPESAVVLVNPRIPLPTGRVFRRYGGPYHANPGAYPEGFSTFEELLAFLAVRPNDLESAATACVPEIATMLEALGETEGCRLSRMSGSGATCFGLYPTFADSHAAARMLAGSHPDWWIQAASVGTVQSSSGSPP